MSHRLAWAALVAVLAGSFAFNAYRAQHPTTGYQSADERSYGKLAVALADHHSYSGGLKDPLHWPPGAPVAFALGHKLFPDEKSATTADIPSAYWIQALASLGTAICAAVIAGLLAGAWAGVAAAALVGFYPPLILATGEQISEPLGAFWLTLAFALFALGARRGRAWLFALGGLSMGAAVLTRADLLPVPFVLAALVVLWTWRSAHDLRRGLIVGASILGGAVLAIAPWSAYASHRAGELVPVTRGSASALFVGTYLPGGGTTVGMKRSLGAAAKRRNPKLRHIADFDLEARSVLAVVADRHPDLDFNAAVSLEARRNISRYARQDPLGFARMMLNKVQRMWSRYARGGARHTSPVIRGWHVLLVLLAVAGLLAGIVRRHSLLLACILAAALTSTAVHMLVVSQARYNLPLVPALLAGGVAGWAMFARGPSRAAAGDPKSAAAARPSRKPGENLSSAPAGG